MLALFKYQSLFVIYKGGVTIIFVKYKEHNIPL